MKAPLSSRLFLCSLLTLLAATAARATTYNVSSISDLNAKIGIAVPGDVIIVANGSYTASGAINVSRAGNAANPIIVQAATIGGAEIKGSGSFSFNSGSAFWIVQGFKFTDSQSLSISSSANHIRVTRCIFELTIASGGNESYININGDDVEIDHNELRNKSTLGEMLDIAGSGSQVARRLWVHHNYFHDFTSPGGNGAETIRWGLSGLSLSTGDGICEYNLFVRCNGENELISNKSSGNTYRFNAFLDSPGAQMSQRHGNDCLYYGNYFRNTDGLRVFGDRHQIFANYFEGNTTGVDMGNGDGEVENGDPLDCHDKPDDCVVSFNTFITNSVHYKMGGRTGGLGAANITVANNIYQGNGNMASISSSAPYTGTWSGNIRWNNNNAGNMPSSGYTTVNPLLALDSKGVYHIQSGSPAIGAAVGSYPAVIYDMDGQPRDSLAKDVGADEFSTAPITARLLTTNDVGILSSNLTVFRWEAESIDTATNGAAALQQTDANASDGGWLSLQADAPGDWIEFTTPTIPPGNYDVLMSYKAHPNRGILQLTVDGANVGGTLDEYSATVFYPQQVFGTVSFASGDSHTIRLTVTGINGSSGAYTLSADLFTFAQSTNLPQVSAPTFSPGPGTYSSVQSVAINTLTSGATIRYTTDNSTPTQTHGTVYTGPVAINVTTTLKAIAYKSGMNDSSVTSGTYTISIPDFTLSATPASQTLLAGNSTNFTVNLGNVNAFTGTVTFGVTGLPANTTANFSPTSSTAPGSSTLTVNTTASTPAGSSTLTITGTSGSLNHTDTVSLVIQDFTVSVTPSSQSVAAGNNTAYTVNVASLNGFNGPVNFSVSGLGSGATGTFNPTSVTGSGSATLTIVTTAGAATGTFTLTITGTSGSISRSGTVTLVVNAPVGPLPAGWTDVDVGAVGVVGDASYTSGTFTLDGSGVDIWSTADEFHYAYESTNGDVTVIARVATVESTAAWAKAGVMIRETTAANSAYVGLYVTPSNGVSMQLRPSSGSTAIDLARQTGLTAPYWVKLVRSGSSFTGFSSADGSSWTQVGATNVTMANSVTAGLVDCAHNDTTLNTSTFDNVSVSVAGPLYFEAEDLAFTTNGAALNVVTDAAASGGVWVSLLSTNSGPWVEFTLTNVPAGTYDLTFFYKQHPNRAIHSLTVDGVKLDGDLDQYSATVAYTNKDFGVITFATTGNHVVRLTATGKNAAAGTPNISADAFQLTPASQTWSHQDIGAVGLAGSFSQSSGTYSVAGSGSDIWTAADQFHYAYQAVSGDMTITARVATETQTASFAKAGVMLRASLATNSVEASVLLTPTNGVAMEVRPTTGASTINVTGWVGGATPPSWVRLTRSGNTFTAFSSSNGTSWTQIGSTNVTMSAGVTAGLAVTAHDNTKLNTSTFDSVSLP